MISTATPTLQGRIVRLVPLERDHIPALYEIACTEPERYRFTSTPVTPEQCERYFGRALHERETGIGLPFTVLSADGSQVLGTSRFTDIRAQHRNAELGYTWYRGDAIGTAVNSECKYLMFRYAFEELGLLRVEIHADTRNERSQAAIRAVGGVFEGVLRRQQITKDGYVRDTMVFSVTDLDWPAVKTMLERRLRSKGVEPPV